MAIGALPETVRLSNAMPRVGVPPTFLLPETTCVTVPCTGEPAAAARRPPTTRSDARRPCTRLPTCAVLVLTAAVSSTASWVPAGTRIGGGGGGRWGRSRPSRRDGSGLRRCGLLLCDRGLVARRPGCGSFRLSFGRYVAPAAARSPSVERRPRGPRFPSPSRQAQRRGRRRPATFPRRPGQAAAVASAAGSVCGERPHAASVSNASESGSSRAGARNSGCIDKGFLVVHAVSSHPGWESSARAGQSARCDFVFSRTAPNSEPGFHVGHCRESARSRAIS